MANRSILDVLPLDIVELVIREGKNYDRKDFCGLRLVCKAVNELVEPEVFSTITIHFIRDDSEEWKNIPQFLLSLVSGTSPYVRWAKELQLSGLIPIQFANVYWSQYDPWQGEEREAMLACQQEWLTAAIESLVQVERVEFVANSREPYHDVFRALATLPRLRDLSITFHSYSPFEDVPFAGFSNLNSVRLTGLPMTPHILDGVKALLSKSPSITELSLNAPYQSGGPEVKKVEFSSMVEDVMQPNFSPSLKKLTISAAPLKLSPPCAPFLRSLTSLEILNDSAHVQPSFWKALQDSGVHLQELKVAPLRQPIVDYLLSYPGLRRFTLDWPEQDTEDVEKIVPRFFHDVLPRHRDAIQSISFKHTKLGPWTINQSYLNEGVYLCKKLKYLTLIYYFPSPNEKHTHPVIPLANLFSEISDNLPQLEILRLEHTRKFQRSFGCGFACGQYFQTVGRAFANHIMSSKSQFFSKRPPQFDLAAAGTTFISKSVSAASSGSGPDSGGGSGGGEYYRFDLPNASDHLELRSDELVSDCDAYSGDEGFY
ncbi:hypothetical protein EST38_g6495 [Candolleomyces aberdarensis]|uniref:F-box domain-containing protein n=1 Tax=Candolleomyces aberdarensis TaxID=2316362 RepID=A0A4Q2DJK8_9AGAR|nr:hypothetical protein EST38_g6495 [Candolleomyces aberdarensis]